MTLAAFSKASPGYVFPQTLVATATGSFAPGQGYMLTFLLPSCGFNQIDLIENLTPADLPPILTKDFSHSVLEDDYNRDFAFSDVVCGALCQEWVNPHGQNVPPAGQTPPGTNPRSGQNPDGFYLIGNPGGGDVFVVDQGSGMRVRPVSRRNGDQVHRGERRQAEREEDRKHERTGRCGVHAHQRHRRLPGGACERWAGGELLRSPAAEVTRSFAGRASAVTGARPAMPPYSERASRERERPPEGAYAAGASAVFFFSRCVGLSLITRYVTPAERLITPTTKTTSPKSPRTVPTTGLE